MLGRAVALFAGAGRAPASPLGGQCEEEGGTGAGFRFDPDTATVPFHDRLAYRETHPRAFGISCMQALKWLEHSFDVIGLDTWTVVPHGNKPLVLQLFRADVNAGRALGSIAQRVTQQNIENLHEPVEVAGHNRERAAGYLGACDCAIPYRVRQGGTDRKFHPDGLE